jgi:hypothetical protein
MKYQKNAAGHYVIKGKTYEQLFGSRAQVMHGTAYKTAGLLTREDLIQNKHGRIVSKSKYNTGKNKNKNNLLLNGYTAKKGRFGYVKVGSKTQRRRGRKGSQRGGTADVSNPGTPAPASISAESSASSAPSPAPSSTPSAAPSTPTASNQLPQNSPGATGGGVVGYESSPLAMRAASFSGGKRRKTRGGIYLGGKKKGGIYLGGSRKRSHKRRGGALPSLSPADF